MSSLILPPGYAQNRSGTMVHNRPQANPQIEQDVRLKLQDIDSLLDIKWIENIVYNERHKAFEGRYALVCRWPYGDPRWLMIEKGEIGNTPYDILGWFTEDMQNAGTAMVSPELLENKVLELLATADNTKVNWRQRLSDSAKHNIELKRKRRSEFVEQQAHAIAADSRNQALGIHQVSVLKEIKSE